MHIRQSSRDRRRWRGERGIVLMEVTATLLALLILSVLLLKSYVTVIGAQRWTVVQGMTDSYIARETALGKRTPFADVTGSSSLWPTSPTTSSELVIVGTLPGGFALTGTLHRTKVPHSNNLFSDGGAGTLATNPSKMESWKLQSHLTYQLSGRTYVKARTTVRSQ